MKKLKLFLLSILLILGSKTFAQLSSGDIFMDMLTKSEYTIIMAGYNTTNLDIWYGTLVMLLEPVIGGFNTSFEIYDPNGYKKFYGRLSNTKEMMIEDNKLIKLSTLELNGNRRGQAIVHEYENGNKVLLLQFGDEEYAFIYQ